MRPAANGREHASEVVRYAAVVILGLGVDIGAGLFCRWLTGMPLVASGVVGFCAGVATNYLLCEKWVFRTGQVSWRRLGQAYLAGSAALCIRISAIWIAGIVWKNPDFSADFFKLMTAAGLSFGANFLLLRKFLR